MRRYTILCCMYLANSFLFFLPPKSLQHSVGGWGGRQIFAVLSPFNGSGPLLHETVFATPLRGYDGAMQSHSLYIIA